MASSDVNVINIEVLKQYHSNFTSEKSRFSNFSYKVFSDSYIKKCQDTYISKIARKLEQCYEEAEDFYKEIDNWWKDYNEEATNIENVLSGNTTSGVFNHQALRQCTNELPELRDYTFVFDDVVVQDINVTPSEIGDFSSENKNVDKTLTTEEEKKQKIIEMLGFNEISKERVSLGNFIAPLVAFDQEIANLDQQLEDMKEAHTKNYYNFKYNPNKEKESLAEQEKLEKIIEEYKKIRETAEETMLEYLGITKENVGTILEFYNYSTEEERKNLLKSSVIMLSTEVPKVMQFEGINSPQEEKEFSQVATNTVKGVGFNVLEGIGKGLEKIMDGLCVIGTAYQAQQLQNTVIVSDQMGLLFGEEHDIFSQTTANQLTDEMWQGTKEFVSKEYVKDSFDYFYENVELGQEIYAYAYKPEETRALVSEVTSFVTTLVIGGEMAPATIFVSSLGGNTSDAWNDGATLEEGLAYGAANASYDTFEYFLGQGIGGLKFFKGGSALRNQLLNTGTHVILDAADGATSAFVNPFLKMIYAPNANNVDELLYIANHDAEGNQINNYTSWDELSGQDQYWTLFEYNGGKQAVLTEAINGAAMSIVGEAGDIFKATKVDSIVNSLSDGNNKELMDSIASLDDSQLEELINVASNKNMMDQLVNNLEPEQLDRAIDSLTHADIKRLVDAGNADIFSNALNNNQLKKLYDKMGDSPNLKEFKDDVGKKLDDTTVKLVDDDATLKLVDDDATLKLVDDDTTLKSVDDDATVKLVDDDATVKLVDDDATLKLVDDDATLKLVDDDATLKLVDDDATLKLVDDDATVKLPEDNDKIVKISTAEKYDVLATFIDKTLDDGVSDQQLVALMFNTFKDAMNNDNQKALSVLKMFNTLKKNNPDLKIALATDSTMAYWDRSESAIVIGKNTTYSNVLLHELGHCLYDSVLDGKLPNNWDKISANARYISSNNKVMGNFGNSVSNLDNYIYNMAKEQFEFKLKNDYGLSLDEYEEVIAKQYSQILADGLEGDDLRLKLKQLNYGDDVIDMIFTKDYDADDVATATIMGAISELEDQIYNTQYSDYIALSDIIDAVYEGEKLDLNGNQIKTTYTHGSEYYSNSEANASFHEIIANFTQIKISGHQNSLDCIRAMFGEEFYNLLEETFSKFCNSN